MRNLFSVIAVMVVIAACATVSGAQQPGYRLPDLKSMKHLTTSSSEHAPDIPGKETTMDFYSAPSGEIFTVYSYRGKTVAFSTHSNSDPQNTLRVFMDLTGQGVFQEINRTTQWQLPAWVRQGG